MKRLSKHNTELIDLKDRLLMEALLEHWGHTVKTVRWGDSFKYTEIDGVGYTNSAAAKNRVVEIINENSDANGVIIL